MIGDLGSSRQMGADRHVVLLIRDRQSDRGRIGARHRCGFEHLHMHHPVQPQIGTKALGDIGYRLDDNIPCGRGFGPNDRE